MSALSIQPTFPIFTESDGLPLENGYIWIGAANLDPQGNPIAVYWDAALTQPAGQPIRTLNGYPSRNGTPARLYVNSDYSIRVQNSKGSLVYSAPAATERFGDLITASTIAFTGFNGQVGTVADLADNDGSDWIGFEQSGTGVVARSAQDKMRDILSVKDFGAVGDGVADDTTAVIDALTAAVAATPATLVFPAGTYKCTTALGSFTGSNIEIDLQGSVLDFSSLTLASTGPLLEFAGTYGSTAALTSNAIAGAKTLSVDSSGFAAGDMVRVYSNAIWDSTRTSTRFGEINFIEGVPSSVSVDLTMDLQTGYTTADSATLQKLMPVVNVTIRNGSIRGPSGNDEILGLRIRVGESCLIENIKSYDVDKIHVQLTDCVFSKVTKCHFEQSNHSSQAYGVSFADACQDCTAIDNSFVDVRHSLSTNNNVSTSYGITRRILFANNIVSDSSTATGGSGGDAIDTHAGAEDIYIIGNTVNSASNYGVNFEARTGAVQNNYIENTAAGGIHMNPRADSAGSVTVSGNTLQNIGNSTTDYGILVSAQTADLVNCVVANNRVVSFAQSIRVVGSAPYTVIRASISGNTVQKQSASTSITGLEVSLCNYAAVTGNSVLTGAVGIVLSDCQNSVVSGNAVEISNTSGATGYGVRVTGVSAYSAISSNSVRYSSSGITTTVGVSFGSSVTYSGAWNNVTQGFGTNVNIGAGTGNASANNI